jgi:ribosomal protein S18 acetylase RimI-like enzyme
VPFVRELYAHDSIAFDAARVRRALGALLEDQRLGRAWLIEDPAPVGYMIVAFGYSIEFGGRNAFLDELFVSPEQRGRGLGTRALEIAAQACREAGIVALHLEVDRANTNAQRLYRAHGFVDHDRYLMTRRLSDRLEQ